MEEQQSQMFIGLASWSIGDRFQIERNEKV